MITSVWGYKDLQNGVSGTFKLKAPIYVLLALPKSQMSIHFSYLIYILLVTQAQNFSSFQNDRSGQRYPIYVRLAPPFLPITLCDISILTLTFINTLPIQFTYMC